MHFELMHLRIYCLPALAISLFGCGSSSPAAAVPPGPEGGSEAGFDGGSESGPVEAGPPADSAPESAPSDAAEEISPVPTPPSSSNIKHLVVIVQENHSFDSYFGHYCTAATGSNPTCTTGPSCCEAAPSKDPGTGDAFIVLDDAANGMYDPSHLQACELAEIDNGKMDMYATAAPAGCGTTKNLAIADSGTAMPYWSLAQQNAIADRYFQPIAGQSSSNDMYFARANYVFTDNSVIPASIGAKCSFGTQGSYTDQTIGDLLIAGGIPWGWYGAGYQVMLDAQAMNTCPKAPADCPAMLGFYPCIYDPSDVPFEYYKSLADNPKYMFDYSALAADLGASALPAVSFVKGLGYQSEHPGYGTIISTGASFVDEVIKAVEQSPYAASTLILVTYDESGGFFDHVAPPAASTVDQQPYGPRVPLMAVGPFAKKNFVSHVQMEHSSIVKFIEWNWLGAKTGQLGTRDTTVNNIGSLLDAAATGTAVPEQ